MNNQFSKTELQMLANILDMAANEFSNHGSNDFAVEPTQENKELLIDIIKATSCEEDAEYEIEKLEKPSKSYFGNKDCYYSYDWVVMRYFASKCKNLAKE